MCLALKLLSLIALSISGVSSFEKTNIEYLNNQKQLENRLQSRFRNEESGKEELFTGYRVEYPSPEEYIIHLVVNPCGANGTHNSLDKTISHGYDCCMERFGRGEYGYHKYDSLFHNGTVMMSRYEIFNRRILAAPDEVLHNIVIVDEDGTEIPFEHSRRAHDHTAIDESCVDFRDPHPSCLQERLRAIASRYVPPCWDHNSTVDATLTCYTPDGGKNRNCMQVGFSQNAFVTVCNGEYGPSGNLSALCGTYIEIHRPNGSPYDAEGIALAEKLITTTSTKGMITTKIDLTYKGDKTKILCAYDESKIRLGTMVRVLDTSPRCCCPPKYHRVTRKGSFMCPIKSGTDGGPFADEFDLLSERLERDKGYETYPRCNEMDENKDMMMCSRDFTEFMEASTKEILLGPNKLFYPDKCEDVSKNTDGLFSSSDLDGNYSKPCILGAAFNSCGSINDEVECKGKDHEFNFHGRLGKVTKLATDVDPLLGVTFNDGRTVYYFEEYQLRIEPQYSNYEIWLVLRNRYEKILQKRKGFKVVWPMCTFDSINDRYLPYAQFTEEGDFLDCVFGKYEVI